MAFKYCWINLLVFEILQSINQVGSEDFLYQEHHVCDEYLVSGPKYRVPDEQLSASSQYNELHAAKWGRLNTVYVKDNHMGGWSAKDDKGTMYIEVRLNELSIVQAIATQGRNRTGDSQTNPQYVTKYHVYCNQEGENKWGPVLGSSGNNVPMDFQGNNDSNSIHINKLPCAVLTNAVRIHVKSYHDHPSMRFDVIGCPVSQVDSSPDCDFEDGFCGWNNGKDNDSVHWELKSEAISVPESLKLHDHAYKNETGFVAYLKSTAASSPNRSAQLVTMIRKSNIARCLHLWSSGSYPSIGLLNISVIGCRTTVESGVSKLVTDFTQEWNHVSLDVSYVDYKLIVEGTIRYEVEGYLAIDDISLTKGECPGCSFDEGFCNWKNEDNDWVRIVHDSQRYIVVNGDNENASTKAKLLGPQIDAGNKSSCLSFSYNMSGHENNALTVSLSLNQENSTLGMLRENSFGRWKNAFFKIENIDEKYKIRFLAFVKNGYIGLDDISLIFEPCPDETCLIEWFVLFSVRQRITKARYLQYCKMDIFCLLEWETYDNILPYPDHHSKKVITTTMAAPSIWSTIPDSFTTADTRIEYKAPGVVVGVAVGVAVLSLVVLVSIRICIASRRRLRSSAATTSKHIDHKIALSVEYQPGSKGNEVYIDARQEYANVMSGKSQSDPTDPTYGNIQVESTHETRLITQDCEYAVVSKPKRNTAQETQEEEAYDHLHTGEKIPNLDDETYDHVNK